MPSHDLMLTVWDPVLRTCLDKPRTIMDTKAIDTLYAKAKRSLAEESKHETSIKKAKIMDVSPLFTLKKWNAVAMWSWDVNCDICAICRVSLVGKVSL